MFAKLEAHVKKAAAMTLGALSLTVKKALDAVMLPDIQGFLSILDLLGQLP